MSQIIIVKKFTKSSKQKYPLYDQLASKDCKINPKTMGLQINKLNSDVKTMEIIYSLIIHHQGVKSNIPYNGKV